MVRQSASGASGIQRGRHLPDRRRGALPAEALGLALGIQRRVERLAVELVNRLVDVANPPTAETVVCRLRLRRGQSTRK